MSGYAGSGAPMGREEADAALAALGTSYERLAAAMFALDGHPGLAALRGPGLSGTTAEVAEQVQARTGVLWAQFTALREHHERARAVRAEKSRPGPEELAELSRLLRDPVVELDDDGLPLDPGTPTAPARWLPLAELAELLSRACAEVTELLSEVDAAVSAATARLVPVAEALAQAQALAADLAPASPVSARAEPGADPADRLAAEFADARDRVLADPLGAAPDGASPTSAAASGVSPIRAAASGDAGLDGRLRRIASDVDAVLARLRSLATLRDEHPHRLARLREEIDAVAAREDEAGRSYATMLAKIASPGLPPLPHRTTALRNGLAALEPLLRERRWARLAEAMAELARSTADAGRDATGLRDAADGLLARRAELRGRLAAYRAKAASAGLAEHPGLSARHTAAFDLLYTSPCDLPAATRAVLAYQTLLAELTSTAHDREPSQ